MKKAIFLIVLSVLGANTAALANAGERSLTIVLAGGAEMNQISIRVSPDGRSYVIDSIAPLEVGGNVCVHPESNFNELSCEAAPIDGFEINTGAGDDVVLLARDVPVPATLRGGAGNDKLIGGAAADKLIGGGGDDTLIGRAGGDWLYGGLGNDKLIGGPGDDLLRGGPGENKVRGGSGQNDISPHLVH